MVACPELFREPFTLAASLAPALQARVALPRGGPVPPGGEPFDLVQPSVVAAPAEAVRSARTEWAAALRSHLLRRRCVADAARIACVLVAVQLSLARKQRGAARVAVAATAETVTERMARLEQLEAYQALWDLVLLELVAS